MEDFEGGNMGTLHSANCLPLVPPSFDETILYGKYICFYLRMPNQLYNGRYMSEQFWKEIRRRNKLPPKIATRMLCVLLSNKDERQQFLDLINNNQQVWENKSISD